MSKIEKYLVLQPPFTLDKWKDGAAQSRNEKEFQELKNYIPYDGSIVTREGVLLISHTPQTTSDETTPFPECGGTTIVTNGTAEVCICRMVLDFERGNDFIGWNSVIGATGINPIFTAMKCPNYIDNETGTTGQATCVGVGFASAKAGSNKFIEDSAPSTNIYASSPARSYGIYTRGSDIPPSWLYTGTAANTCVLYTYWLWPYYNNASEDNHIQVETIDGFGNSMSFRHFNDDYQVQFRNSGTTTYSDAVNGGISPTQRWYFCAGWIDFPNRTKGIYLYDDVLGTEKWTANLSLGINASHHLNIANNEKILSIGGSRVFDASGGGYRADDSEALRGQLDYITMWDTIPSIATSVITLIRLIRDLHKA